MRRYWATLACLWIVVGSCGSMPAWACEAKQTTQIPVWKNAVLDGAGNVVERLLWFGSRPSEDGSPEDRYDVCVTYASGPLEFECQEVIGVPVAQFDILAGYVFAVTAENLDGGGVSDPGCWIVTGNGDFDRDGHTQITDFSAWNSSFGSHQEPLR